MSKNQNKGAGSKKYGRNKRKALAKTSKLSKYVRGVITFENYNKN